MRMPGSAFVLNGIYLQLIFKRGLQHIYFNYLYCVNTKIAYTFYLYVLFALTLAYKKNLLIKKMTSKLLKKCCSAPHQNWYCCNRYVKIRKKSFFYLDVQPVPGTLQMDEVFSCSNKLFTLWSIGVKIDRSKSGIKEQQNCTFSAPRVEHTSLAHQSITHIECCVRNKSAYFVWNVWTAWSFCVRRDFSSATCSE